MVQRQDLVSQLTFVLGVGDTNDSVLNALTSDQLEDILRLKSAQLDISYPNVPREYEQVLICLAKKEVYWKMAIVSAPLYPLDLDGLKVSKNIRFDHYMTLVQEATKEYTTIMNDPNRITVKYGDLLVDKYYNKRKQYINYDLPTVYLNVDNIGENTIDLSFSYGNLIVSDFVRANIYIGDKPLYDKYEDIIIKEAKKVATITDVRKQYIRIHEVDTLKPIYLLLEVQLKNGLVAYTEAKGVLQSE